MPLRIFNNLSSVIAQNRLDVNNRNLGEAISRIASGNRLTGTKTSPAEKTTSELLRSDTRTLRQASKNLNDGISLVNVAESVLNEQAGILMDGELEMIIGDESKLLKPGDMYIVPGNIEHYATATDKGAKVIDIFAPVRDEFKY